MCVYAQMLELLDYILGPRTKVARAHVLDTSSATTEDCFLSLGATVVPCMYVLLAPGSLDHNVTSTHAVPTFTAVINALAQEMVPVRVGML